MINAQPAIAEARRASSFGLIAPDEERHVLLKPVMHLSFIYGVLRGLVYNYWNKGMSKYIKMAENNFKHRF